MVALHRLSPTGKLTMKKIAEAIATDPPREYCQGAHVQVWYGGDASASTEPAFYKAVVMNAVSTTDTNITVAYKRADHGWSTVAASPEICVGPLSIVRCLRKSEASSGSDSRQLRRSSDNSKYQIPNTCSRLLILGFVEYAPCAFAMLLLITRRLAAV